MSETTDDYCRCYPESGAVNDPTRPMRSDQCVLHASPERLVQCPDCDNALVSDGTYRRITHNADGSHTVHRDDEAPVIPFPTTDASRTPGGSA